MTRGEAKRRAYELASQYLRSDLDAGAILSEDPEEFRLIEDRMREIIDSLLRRAGVSYEHRWGAALGLGKERIE